MFRAIAHRRKRFRPRFGRYPPDRTGRVRAACALGIFGLSVVAGSGVAVRGGVTLSRIVVPIQRLRIFPSRDLVRSIAERQRAGKSATADVSGFAANGHLVGKVAKALYESWHDGSFRYC